MEPVVTDPPYQFYDFTAADHDLAKEVYLKRGGDPALLLTEEELRGSRVLDIPLADQVPDKYRAVGLQIGEATEIIANLPPDVTDGDRRVEKLRGMLADGGAIGSAIVRAGLAMFLDHAAISRLGLGTAIYGDEYLEWAEYEYESRGGQDWDSFRRGVQEMAETTATPLYEALAHGLRMLAMDEPARRRASLFEMFDQPLSVRINKEMPADSQPYGYSWPEMGAPRSGKGYNVHSDIDLGGTPESLETYKAWYGGVAPSGSNRSAAEAERKKRKRKKKVAMLARRRQRAKGAKKR